MRGGPGGEPLDVVHPGGLGLGGGDEGIEAFEACRPRDDHGRVVEPARFEPGVPVLLRGHLDAGLQQGAGQLVAGLGGAEEHGDAGVGPHLGNGGRQRPEAR